MTTQPETLRESDQRIMEREKRVTEEMVRWSVSDSIAREIVDLENACPAK
jgi:hypothetical protein